MTDHTVFEERICAMLDGELSDGEAPIWTNAPSAAPFSTL